MNYKFVFYILILIIFACNPLLSSNKVSFGISSSFNSSNINFYNNFFPQNIKTQNLSNYGFSFFTEIKNPKNAGIRIQVSKVRKGWSENFDNQIINNEFDYLNIPILMTTYFGKQNLKLNFSLGPYAEFQINNNLKKLKSMFPDNDFFFDSDRDNTFGYGIKLSGGLSLDFNKSSFLFLASYSYNFDNLIDVKQKTNLIPDISSFRTLSFSLVYLINFNSK